MKRCLLTAALLCLLLTGCGRAAASAVEPQAQAALPAETTQPTVQAPAASCPAGISPLADYPEADVTVDETMYANWVNELTWNCELYLEKTVRVQGLYTMEHPDGLDAAFSYVYRIGPGCCGTDGDLCGFQILLPEGVRPAEGDWIDVYGTLCIRELEGYRFLVLDDTAVTVDNTNPGLINVHHTI